MSAYVQINDDDPEEIINVPIDEWEQKEEELMDSYEINNSKEYRTLIVPEITQYFQEKYSSAKSFRETEKKNVLLI